MKTKNCPFCSKEISDEAIICKFCHRLLIDENGNDILPEDEYDEEDIEIAPDDPGEPVFDEEKTIVYNKEDLQNLMNKNRSEEEDEEEYETEEFDTSAVIGSVGGDELSDNDPKGDEFEDDGEEYDPEPQPVFRRSGGSDDGEYEDEELANSADYDPKRTFMITAIVTLGILLIIIVAVLVGYKLFGFGDKDGGTTTSQTQLTTSAPADSAAPAADTASVANPDDSSFVPQLTDDTVSENPEEIANSSLSDPAVVDPNAAPTTPVVDSAAATPETVVSADSSSGSDQPNIVIIPDPSVTSSAADSTADSAASADSVGDGPAATDSSTADSSSQAAEPAGPGAPAFDAAGSYYSWSEAESLMSNYASANGLGSFAYAYGTDGVEMIYEVYDDAGNVSYYRVDLQTGYVSAY